MKQKLFTIGTSLNTTVLIITTAALVLVSARNTFTWHLINMWGLSGDFWQNLWVLMLELFNYNAPVLFILGSSLAGVISFWGYNAFLLYIDITGKPAFLQQYKIQDSKQVPVDKEKLRHCIFVVIKNQFIITCMIALSYPLLRWRGMPWTSELPSFQRLLFELAGCVIVEEFGFYYTHRLLHHPKLYKRFHKVHHEWTAPTGIVGLYTHPVETMLSGSAPVILGPLLVGAHLATFWLWIAMVNLNISNSHSGYHFPSFPSPEQHDYHHIRFNQCYGVLGILDRLHNTNGQFLASKNYQRHITFFSTTPVRETFPDDDEAR